MEIHAVVCKLGTVLNAVMSWSLVQASFTPALWSQMVAVGEELQVFSKPLVLSIALLTPLEHHQSKVGLCTFWSYCGCFGPKLRTTESFM